MRISDWSSDVCSSDLVEAAGGFREGFEGSQDYDLALRVIERSAVERVRHIPHVLYHWRVLEGSVALSADEKSYAHDRGRQALVEHFARRREIGRAHV